MRNPVKKMVKNRTKRVILVICLAVTGTVFLAFCWGRNDLWEICTTKAYGFPMPWYIDHCLCGKGQTAVNPLFCFVNLILWVGASLVLAWSIEKISGAGANDQLEGIAPNGSNPQWGH
ncbi:MAG: hypothetical protein CMJ49_13115 [Planctomycetaceae bacterium]|nr:hypothetical protein [Planctomycetaceae bacterium]